MNGSAAQLALTSRQSVTGTLGDISSSDAEVTTSFVFPARPSGSSASVAVIGRRVSTGSSYQARAIVAGDGSVTLEILRGATVLDSTTPGITVSVGDTLDLEVRVTGTSPTTISAKVWKDSGSEPASFALTTTDSSSALQTAGTVGFSAAVGRETSKAVFVIGVDNFTADAG